MDPTTVLYLDTCEVLPGNCVWIEIALNDLHRSHTIDEAIWCYNVHSPTQNELDALLATSQKKTYDLVIVGNNNGSGLDVVRALPSELRSKVIVVANALPLHPSEDRGYRRLGVMEFSGRLGLRESVKRVLDIK